MNRENFTLNLPEKPGVYKFIDGKGKIIYIGKAKNLKKRVSSYFSKKFNPFEKTFYLLKEIKDIKFIITSSEYEAFLLEMKLINKYKPKYNVMMRDDKSYPYLKIDLKDPFPGIYYVRRDDLEKNDFHVGPFISSKSAKKILEIVETNFKIRTCKMDLRKQKRERPCLKYYLDRCLAPCIPNKISKEKYEKEVKKAILFLKKEYKTLITEIEEEIKKAIGDLKFERGIELREQLNAIKKLSEKQSIFTDIKGKNLFVNFKRGNLYMGIAIIYMEDGVFKEFDSFYLEKSFGDTLSNSINEVVSSFLLNKIDDIDTIYFPQKIDISLIKEVTLKNLKKEVEFRFSPKGIPLMVLNLAGKNLREQIPEEVLSGLMNELKEELRLTKIPSLIEAIDISNLGDKYLVGTVIAFKNGKFQKNRYRRFRIKSLNTQNDFLSIYEIVKRKYGKVSEKNLPDLIIIDGGKGQLQSALKALSELNIKGKMDIISIAKKEEIIYTKNGYEIKLSQHSPVLKFIQMIRNEVHRFSINYHRILRDRDFLKISLTKIPTIGPIKAKKLLKTFSSVEELLDAKRETVENLIGKKSYENLKNFLKKENLK